MLHADSLAGWVFLAYLEHEDAMPTIASSDMAPGCVIGHRPVTGWVETIRVM